jgi:predicted transcriptional regulator
MTTNRDAIAQLERDRTFSRVRGQVARILLEQAGNASNGHKRLTQREIADMLGTGWCMVHLSLKSLNHDGAININHNRIVVNRALLQKTAETASLKSH